ncbi:hypothetical protein GF382_03425 [Candidatus Falkowbacteria bacterium]|nr:hypothetical protein [Candidatus Falkowbacteria bacterium]
MKKFTAIFIFFFIPFCAQAQEREQVAFKMSLVYGLCIFIIFFFSFAGWWLSKKLKKLNEKYERSRQSGQQARQSRLQDAFSAEKQAKLEPDKARDKEKLS